jgi:hypothetical protein
LTDVLAQSCSPEIPRFVVTHQCSEVEIRMISVPLLGLALRNVLPVTKESDRESFLVPQ